MFVCGGNCRSSLPLLLSCYFKYCGFFSSIASHFISFLSSFLCSILLLRAITIINQPVGLPSPSSLNSGSHLLLIISSISLMVVLIISLHFIQDLHPLIPSLSPSPSSPPLTGLPTKDRSCLRKRILSALFLHPPPP